MKLRNIVLKPLRFAQRAGSLAFKAGSIAAKGIAIVSAYAADAYQANEAAKEYDYIKGRAREFSGIMSEVTRRRVEITPVEYLTLAYSQAYRNQETKMMDIERFMTEGRIRFNF